METRYLSVRATNSADVAACPTLGSKTMGAWKEGSSSVVCNGCANAALWAKGKNVNMPRILHSEIRDMRPFRKAEVLCRGGRGGSFSYSGLCIPAWGVSNGERQTDRILNNLGT